MRQWLGYLFALKKALRRGVEEEQKTFRANPDLASIVEGKRLQASVAGFGALGLKAGDEVVDEIVSVG